MAGRMTFFFSGLFYVTFYDMPWYVLNLHICDAVAEGYGQKTEGYGY